MSRQEATNVFNEGLIMDLNPLTTPDNVLTDCLNGTFITYNGNEFVLQNDQGNYNLENAKLKPNFIPVGIKEHGDILYIVSYNPITKETEIGSYPSPRTIFTTKDRDQVVTFTPLIPDALIDYEQLMQKANLQLYALSDDMENYKLNPGDKFIILLDQLEGFPYQEIQFAILNEDKELLPIDIPDDDPYNKYIWPTDHQVDDVDYKNVFWKVPGWLTGKYRLAVMDQYYLNIRNLRLPEFVAEDTFELTLTLNSQMEISDELFNNPINPSADPTHDLKIEYSAWAEKIDNPGVQIPIKIDSEDVDEYQRSKVLTTHRYHDLGLTYFHNLTFSSGSSDDSKEGRSKDEIIYIEAVPVIMYGGQKVIEYNQFRTRLEINLATINDAREIRAADVLFNHYVEEPTNENPYGDITINFNVSGPFVNNSEIELYLDFYEIGNLTPVESILLSDINLFGQNIREIPFNGPSLGSDGVFKAENIYILTFRFINRDMDGKEIPLTSINKLLIASQTLNKFYNTVSEFNSTLYAEQWLNNYSDYIKIDSLISETRKPTLLLPFESDGVTPKVVEGFWPSNWTPLVNTKISDHPIYEAGYDVNSNWKGTLVTDYLKGNLWSNGNTTDKDTIKYKLSNDQSDSKTIIGNVIDFSIPIKLYESKRFFLSEGTRFRGSTFTPRYFDKYLNYIATEDKESKPFPGGYNKIPNLFHLRGDTFSTFKWHVWWNVWKYRLNNDGSWTDVRDPIFIDEKASGKGDFMSRLSQRRIGICEIQRDPNDPSIEIYRHPGEAHDIKTLSAYGIIVMIPYDFTAPGIGKDLAAKAIVIPLKGTTSLKNTREDLITAINQFIKRVFFVTDFSTEDLISIVFTPTPSILKTINNISFKELYINKEIHDIYYIKSGDIYNYNNTGLQNLRNTINIMNNELLKIQTNGSIVDLHSLQLDDLNYSINSFIKKQDIKKPDDIIYNFNDDTNIGDYWTKVNLIALNKHQESIKAYNDRSSNFVDANNKIYYDFKNESNLEDAKEEYRSFISNLSFINSINGLVVNPPSDTTVVRFHRKDDNHDLLYYSDTLKFPRYHSELEAIEQITK